MTREKATEWLENTFSEWTKEEDRQESIFYLIKKIYNDFENRSCSNCRHWNASNEDILFGNGERWIDCDEIYVESVGNLDFKTFNCSLYKPR